MDTKWNNTKALAGFLAFALGMSLTVSSLGSAGSRIAWEQDLVPRFAQDWQETENFRAEAAAVLKDFLTLGAGGELEFYDYAYWEDDASALVRQEEAYRVWWGFGGVVEEATIGQAASTDSAPVWRESEPDQDVNREPDADYQNDKNVLYYIQGGEGAERREYTNAPGGENFFLEAERLRHSSYVDWGKVPQEQKEYNFFLTFQDGKVSISKNGEELDVYGDGIYDGNSQWFVPGYDNFPATEQLDGVKVCMAIRQTPVRYYSVDYKTGESYNNSSLYYIAQRVEESRMFYRTQAILLGVGLCCLVLWFLLRKSTGPVNQKLASWTVHIWTEVRFLIGLLLTVSLFGGLSLGEMYYTLRDAVRAWTDNYPYTLSAFWQVLARLTLSNVPALLALIWFIWFLHNDHKYNPKEARRSLLKPFLRGLRARDLKRPVEKRLARNQAAGLLALGTFMLIGLVNICILLVRTFHFAGSSPMITIDGVTLFVQLPLALLEIPLVLAFLRFWRNRRLARDIAALADQVEAVRAGDLSKPLILPEDADLRQTAENLNDIQAGMKAALEEQTRSERMKVELISNVSHDLKTPLTSILSYAELLRQEEDLSPAAADYARIIDEKAQRLKGMVEDVFEVSKAAADQLPVHLERLDFGKLLRQTLADTDGLIQASSLVFRVELPEEPVMITADGKRLYRVFQNLIDNALRYALEGSRVYLSLKTAEGLAEASVRNTSRTELPEGVDFTARFVRGDASRTDGGSGLGLSIASSFTEACGGAFWVETVADLFTAIVTFPVEREE